MAPVVRPLFTTIYEWTNRIGLVRSEADGENCVCLRQGESDRVGCRRPTSERQVLIELLNRLGIGWAARALLHEPNTASVEVIHDADQLHVPLRRKKKEQLAAILIDALFATSASCRLLRHCGPNGCG